MLLQVNFDEGGNLSTWRKPLCQVEIDWKSATSYIGLLDFYDFFLLVTEIDVDFKIV